MIYVSNPEISRVVVGIFPAVKLPPWCAVPVIWRFTAMFWFYRFRQSLDRQNEKTANRQKLSPYGNTAPPVFA